MKKYFALTALPLGVLIALVYYYAVDIPFGDEWGCIFPLIDKFHSGILTFSDIFAQHNEHRIILAKIIMLYNAVLTGWNIYIELAVNILFALGTSIIIFCMIKEIQNINDTKKMLIYFTSACLIFSFSQEDNWLAGFQMQILMCVFFAVLSAFMILRNMIISLIFAVLASFSFANGMLIWPAGFIVLCLNAYLLGERNLSKIFFWLIAGIITICLYFYDFRQMHTSDILFHKIPFMITHPHIFILLFIEFIGSAVSGSRISIAIGAGILGIIIQLYVFAVILKHKLWNRNILFWFMIDLFVIFTAGITAMGRSESIVSTMASRYISISMLFWICTISISAYALEFTNHNIPLKLYLIFVFIILSLSVSEENLFAARRLNKPLSTFRTQIDRGEFNEDVFLMSISPSRDGLKGVNICRKYGIRHFENAPFITESDDIPEAKEVKSDNETK